MPSYPSADLLFRLAGIDRLLIVIEKGINALSIATNGSLKARYRVKKTLGKKSGQILPKVFRLKWGDIDMVGIAVRTHPANLIDSGSQRKPIDLQDRLENVLRKVPNDRDRDSVTCELISIVVATG